MKSQTVFICIFMLSLLALHQCRQMDVGEIDSSSKLYVPKCVHSICKGFIKRDCWCCGPHCWDRLHDCDSSPLCPPP
ncbi:unnamed protein product [Thlaspi arvense]|uniref:Embryo surrounding factor 1 brassicaceae domain-containing protein n=1 Tax=Thlaspi arvense TaxID=13288 RepID=A0AAU9RCD7_THLAR|nr:unnamed protein product [Thlaspi arvense]